MFVVRIALDDNVGDRRRLPAGFAAQGKEKNHEPDRAGRELGLSGGYRLGRVGVPYCADIWGFTIGLLCFHGI